jgi:hypothetical protein
MEMKAAVEVEAKATAKATARVTVRAWLLQATREKAPAVQYWVV